MLETYLNNIADWLKTPIGICFSLLFGGFGVVILTYLTRIYRPFVQFIKKIVSYFWHPKIITHGELKTLNHNIIIRQAKVEDIEHSLRLAEKYFGKENIYTYDRAFLIHKLLEKYELKWVAECCDNGAKTYLGAFSILPVQDCIVELIKNDKIKDNQINEKSILNIKDKQLHYLYIMDLMRIDKSKNHDSCLKEAGKRLIRKLERQLKKITEENKNIIEIFALTATPEGKRLAEMKGMIHNPNFHSTTGWLLYEKKVR